MKKTYEVGGTTGIPDPIPDNVPQHHVNDENDQRRERGEGGKDGHHNGGKAGSGGDTDKTHNESEERNAARYGVQDEGVGEALEGGFVGQVDTARQDGRSRR